MAFKNGTIDNPYVSGLKTANACKSKTLGVSLSWALEKHRNTQQEDLWKNRGAKVTASKGSCFPCKFHVRSLWRHNLLIQGRLVMFSPMSTDLCLMPVVFFLTILSISMHFSVGLFERVWRVWSTMALAFSSWHNSSASAWHSIVVVKTSAASDVFLIYMYIYILCITYICNSDMS